MAVGMIPKHVTFELLSHAAFVADEIWVLCLNQLVVQIQPRKHVLNHAEIIRLPPGNMSYRSYRSYRSYTSAIYLPCLAVLHHEL